MLCEIPYNKGNVHHKDIRFTEPHKSKAVTFPMILSSICKCYMVYVPILMHHANAQFEK
jgi:hypothetical protein